MPVFTKDIPEVDTAYARDISFPLRFGEECDLLMDEDQEVIDQAITLITFIPSGSIILFPQMGSAAQLILFDQLDETSQLIMDTALRNSLESLEPRIMLDKELVFDESADEKKLICLVPYRIKVNGELTAIRMVIDRPITG